MAMAVKSLLCGKWNSPESWTTGDSGMNSSDSSPQELTVADRVIGNQLLFEKIMDTTLYYHDDDSRQLDLKLVNSCKLVSSLWLDQMHIYLGRKGRTLSPIDLRTARDRKKITKFLETFKYSPANRIPLFHFAVVPHMYWKPHIKIYQYDLYRQKDMHTYLECLSHCGTSLVELTIRCDNIPCDVKLACLTFNSRPLSLQNLQKIRIQVGLYDIYREDPSWRQVLVDTSTSIKVRFRGLFWGRWCPERRNRKRGLWELLRTFKVPPSHWAILLLLDRILDASENLQSLSLLGRGAQTGFCAINLGHLQLPPSLQQIELSSHSVIWPRHRDTTILNLSRLPYLTSLSLEIDAVDKFDLKRRILPILTSLCHHLRKLEISNANSCSKYRSHHQRIKTSTIHPNFLSKMDKMDKTDKSEQNGQKWTKWTN